MSFMKNPKSCKRRSSESPLKTRKSNTKSHIHEHTHTHTHTHTRTRSAFRKLLQNPFKHLRWSLLQKCLTIYAKKLHLRCLTGFQIRLCTDLILIARLKILKNRMKNVENKVTLKGISQC